MAFLAVVMRRRAKTFDLCEVILCRLLLKRSLQHTTYCHNNAIFNNNNTYNNNGNTMAAMCTGYHIYGRSVGWFCPAIFFLKAFLVEYISHIQIGTNINATEIAWTSFDSVYHYGWSLNGYVDKRKLKQAILELTQHRSANFPSDYADIHQALVYLTHYLKNYDELHGNRVQNPDVVCFITTSNKTSHSDFEITHEASRLHNNYQNVITVGIGDVNRNHLNIIATESQNAFFLNTTSELGDGYFKDELMRRICM